MVRPDEHVQDTLTTTTPDYLQAPIVSNDMEDAFAKLSASEKGETNYQYQGYPGLSRWMASSSDFLMLRRFSPLQVRCLLALQDDIVRVEREIEAWDVYAQRLPRESKGGNNGSLGHDPHKPRRALIRQVTPLLDQYSRYAQYNQRRYAC